MSELQEDTGSESYKPSAWVDEISALLAQHTGKVYGTAGSDKPAQRQFGRDMRSVIGFVLATIRPIMSQSTLEEVTLDILDDVNEAFDEVCERELESVASKGPPKRASEPSRG